MKFKMMFALVAAASLALTGCPEEKKETDKKEDSDDKKDDKKKKDKKKKDGDTKEAKGDGGDLPKECQDYLKALDDCAGKSDAMKKAMGDTKKAWQDAYNQAVKASPAAKDGYKTSCKTMADALKNNPGCK